jgi:hypothetical protein
VLLHAIEVHDEQRFELPEPGPLELRDVETGATLVCDADAASLSAARRAQQDHLSRLRLFASRTATAFTTWDVARAWQPMLLDHLVRARTV